MDRTALHDRGVHRFRTGSRRASVRQLRQRRCRRRPRLCLLLAPAISPSVPYLARIALFPKDPYGIEPRAANNPMSGSSPPRPVRRGSFETRNEFLFRDCAKFGPSAAISTTGAARRHRTPRRRESQKHRQLFGPCGNKYYGGRTPALGRRRQAHEEDSQKTGPLPTSRHR